MSQHVDLWFGDSWTMGAEIAKYLPLPSGEHIPKSIFPNLSAIDRPDMAFPALVSSNRQHQFINFGCTSSSYDFALFSLIKFCKNNYVKNNKYTAFLCTTGQTRNFGINLLGQGKHYQLMPNQVKFIVDPAYAIYHTTNVLNLFYHICKQHNIQLVLIPVWCIFQAEPSINMVPDQHWMMHDTITDHLFGGFPIDNHELSDTNKTVLAQIEQLDWVHPCLGHPNHESQSMIADFIISKIQ